MNTNLPDNSFQFPEDFKKRMEDSLGATEWQAFASAHQQTSPVSIRLHPAKLCMNEGETSVPWSMMGRYLNERPVFTLDPFLHAGAYYVQEASSMFLEQAFRQTVDLNQALTVLDLSAAPGGKSTHILSMISESSLLISNEVIRSRANVLAENIQKWGYPNCIVTNNDPTDFGNVAGLFDVIVIDAPCSGEGLFRKDPKAMNEWSPENVSLCSARQQRILHDVWPALKKNGILIYSTCTYNSAENEDNLQRFSDEYDVTFVQLELKPEWGASVVSKNNVLGYRFLPHRVAGEGFFLSVMRKNEESETKSARSKSRLTTASKKITESLSPWIKEANRFKLFQHQDLIFALPAVRQQQIDAVLNSLRFVYGGTNIATVKHDKLIPAHALATSTIINHEHFNVAEVDRNTAIRYLRRDTIELPESPPGYTLITFEGCPLGWANVLANRVNNLYPPDWRIRMQQG